MHILPRSTHLSIEYWHLAISAALPRSWYTRSISPPFCTTQRLISPRACFPGHRGLQGPKGSAAERTPREMSTCAVVGMVGTDDAQCRSEVLPWQKQDASIPGDIARKVEELRYGSNGRLDSSKPLDSVVVHSAGKSMLAYDLRTRQWLVRGEQNQGVGQRGTNKYIQRSLLLLRLNPIHHSHPPMAHRHPPRQVKLHMPLR